MPNAEWNPLKASTINILAVDKTGRPQTVITPEPNVNQLPVNQPYVGYPKQV